MEIFQIILLFVTFLTIAVLMFLRKLPALLALPVMAFLFPIISGVSLNTTVQSVLGLGSTKLSEAYTIAIFGSMLSVLLQKTGIAESFIKIGAELSGDKPWTIAVIMLLLITLLFTTLGGLGAIIMVASVVLPIMASVGIGPLTTVGIFLIGLSLGGTLNVGNWAVYTTVLGLTVDEVRTFALIMFSITFVISLVYITVMLYKDGHDINIKSIIVKSAGFILAVCLLYFGYSRLDPAIQSNISGFFAVFFNWLKYIAGILLGLLFIAAIFRAAKGKNENGIHWISYFTPMIPLFLILIYNMNFIAAFIVGLIYGFISTYKKKSLNTFVRAILEGGSVVMPAVALMLGIGMLLLAVLGPPSASVKEKIKLDASGTSIYKVPSDFISKDKGSNIIVKVDSKVKAEWISDSAIAISGRPNAAVNCELNNWPVLNLLKPVFTKIVPTNGIAYILIFMLMAPLALYRGPLNVWGMGFGMAAIFLASGMPAGAIMGLLLSVGQIQGISDPTNTQNVWLANEMRVDVQKILWNTIPYTWIIALLGLIASAFLFMK
jgi:hypothetical protein